MTIIVFLKRDLKVLKITVYCICFINIRRYIISE